MGRRGYVQKRQAEHDTSVCLSDWAQSSAVEYLEENGIDVHTGDSGGMVSAEDSDHWEIEIPFHEVTMPDGGTDYEPDYGRIEKLVADLRAHPEKVSSDCGEDNDAYGDQLADLLESGLEAARKHGYEWIMVDFW